MPYFKNQQGFTLIELVIVIVILSIIAAVASQMLAQGFNAFLKAQNVTDANWQGQVALERMIRDIRTVRSANDISSSTSTTFSFVNLAGTSMTYTLSGSNLTLNGNVLASGVNSLTFTYYDQNGNVGPSTANIHYVNIDLAIAEGNASYNLSTGVYLRDLSS